jgi:hypothetical protein
MVVDSHDQQVEEIISGSVNLSSFYSSCLRPVREDCAEGFSSHFISHGTIGE